MTASISLSFQSCTHWPHRRPGYLIPPCLCSCWISFWLECPSLPSSLPHLSQQASFKPWQASPPWGSLHPFRAGASFSGAGTQPTFIDRALGSSIPLTSNLRDRGNPCACRVTEKQDIIVLPASTNFPSLCQPLPGLQGSAGGKEKCPPFQDGDCAPRLRESSHDTR